MIVKTSNKEAAFKAVINTWLKDKRVYCNNCGHDFKPELGKCCESPEIGKNIDVMLAIVQQNKNLRAEQFNDLGSSRDKTIRFGVSLPPDLYQILDKYCRDHGDKGLFADAKDLNWFMKKFKCFTIPKEI